MLIYSLCLLHVLNSYYFTVRPRKKNKQSSFRQKSSKSKSKKQSSSSSQSSKQRAGPNSPADIDELVRNHQNIHIKKMCFSSSMYTSSKRDFFCVINIFTETDLFYIILFCSVCDHVWLLQVRQSSVSGPRRQVLELERCEEILKKLMKFRYSWPFRWVTDIICMLDCSVCISSSEEMSSRTWLEQPNIV